MEQAPTPHRVRCRLVEVREDSRIVDLTCTCGAPAIRAEVHRPPEGVRGDSVSFMFTCPLCKAGGLLTMPWTLIEVSGR